MYRHLLTCFRCNQPNLFNIEGQYNATANYSAIPYGFNEGCTPTNGTEEVIEVDPSDGWASLNFIGAQGLKALIVAIDDHPMWLYEADGQYIKPKLVNAITLYNGERYSAMIKLDKPAGNYTMRVADTGGDQVISGYSTLSYKNAKPLDFTPQAYIDYGGNYQQGIINSEQLYLNSFNVPPPSTKSDAFHYTEIHRLGAAYEWTLQGSKLYPPGRSQDAPLLFYPDSADANDQNLVLKTTNGTWVDIVIQSTSGTKTTPFEPPHPIHKHSSKAYMIGQALGPWNWSSVDEAYKSNPSAFNFVDPPYRDTFTTSFLGGTAWEVIRYQVVNPGPYLFHCHIATHQASGMAMAILDGIDVWPGVPREYDVRDGGEAGDPSAFGYR